MKARDFLAKFEGVKRVGDGFLACCRSHDDRHASLSVSEKPDGTILINCFAGCTAEQVVRSVGCELRDLFPPDSRNARKQGAGGITTPRDPRATVQPPPGCTLRQYEEAKKLPADFLAGLGVREISYLGHPAVRIPYLDESGAETAVRFRRAVGKSEQGDNRFCWKKGDKPSLYGRWRIPLAREAGYVVLVEGESDCHTLWFYGIPAIGVPGADNFKEGRDAPLFDGIPVIYLVVEPDKGGSTLREALSKSSLRDRVCFVDLGECKDPSELHCADPDRFSERWQSALAAAMPY